MNFALDVTNPRVKSAMDKLGIEKNELVLKALSDFGSKGTREEIKQLRFDYYTRRLEKTVKLVKNAMQPIRSKTKETNTKTVIEEEVFDKTSVPQLGKEKKLFLNERNKDVLIMALEGIKDLQKGEEKEERKRVKGSNVNKSKRIEKFRKNQQENMNRIREVEEKKVRKALSQSFNYTKSVNPTPKLKNLTENRANSATGDWDISEKLARFDEKLEKSRMLHEKQILMKKESARNQLSFGKLNSTEDETQELIVKIIERTRAVSERREKRKHEIHEKWEKIKNFKEKKAKKIEDLEKEFKKTIQYKEKKLENKLKAAEKIVKNRKASIGKEIELKIEQQKLRDEEASIKIRRTNRMM